MRLLNWFSRLLDPPRTYESVLAELSAGLKDGSITPDGRPERSDPAMAPAPKTPNSAAVSVTRDAGYVSG